MHASAARAPVDAHPLSIHGDRDAERPYLESSDPPKVASAPATLAPPPLHVQSLFARTDAAQWLSIAHIPNDAASVKSWLDHQDSTTRALLSCFAQALFPAASRSIEATLREALSDTISPLPGMPEDSGCVSEDHCVDESPVQQVIQWAVALAHTQDQVCPDDDKDLSTHRAPDIGSAPSSPGRQPSTHGPLVELAPMVPDEARPPPSLPPLKWRARRDVDNSVFVDPYGFVYGMTVSEYRKHVQGEAGQVETIPHAAEPTDLTVAPLPAPWSELSMSSESADMSTLQRVHTVYEEQQKERQHLWDNFVEGCAGPTVVGRETATLWHTIFQSFRSVDRKSAPVDRRWRQFLQLCEQGVPMMYRPAIWSEGSQAHTCAEPGEFQALLSRPPMDEQIDLDVTRTMPTNLFFGSQGPGVAKLRRILHAYTQYNRTCGYCQGMNNLAAILLLTYSNEEDAFWTFVGLIDHVLPPGYYAADMLVPQADQQVLTQMVRRGQPKLAAHMKALHVELAAVTYTWFLSLFTSCLPMETLFRVWDLLMVDGSIVLFRVAYAILVMASPSLLATSTAASFYHRLRFCTAHLFGADELIHTAVSLREKIRRQDVDAWRARHLAVLRGSPS
ncbi:Similar to S.cerevisiae protein MDR1 (Cytoplasmic GTPase-activating protein) [Malassezia sympodialis ATCC 42132]|uniref:Similar to S.cerevisiae protein MDR1 (Cytoplasmic GTPase-activating protein) n=2 Tax=Malassezia sympodialis (strain ATCC 42132) TaxID=1230383 RepID=A0A1M8A466_MALS4|nr:Similar to S.cerevisiae protein MDR1 (Cytoplasmic GTPase-activating protein) [Malassezia sympodialis ATCC 42132]